MCTYICVSGYTQINFLIIFQAIPSKLIRDILFI